MTDVPVAQSQSPVRELHECVGASLTVLVDQVTLADDPSITQVIGWLQRARELAAVLGVMQDNDLPMDEYRGIVHLDDNGVDIGDWLPQNRAHYERVGPFRLPFCLTCNTPLDHIEGDPDDPSNYEHTLDFEYTGDPHQPAPEWREVDWQTWWARDESKVENWTSYGIALQHKCRYDEGWHDTGESLWGLDYVTGSKSEPTEGDTITVDHTPDPYLAEVLRDLAREHRARAK